MILPFRGKWPSIHETAFVAPSADVIGDVTVGSHSSIWFQCTVRGDVHFIRIGDRTNIQDNSVLHVTRAEHALTIGSEVTVGHRVILHGCAIGDRVLVGMGAIVMDAAQVGDECVIGAGALVTQGTKIPPRSLVMGFPAKVVRTLSDDELARLRQSAEGYVENSREYLAAVPGARRLGAYSSDLDFDDEAYEEGGR